MISSKNMPEDYIWMILSTVLTVVVYFFILWLFVFKTSWLIDKLHLEKGFEDEKIELNIQLATILPIAIIVTGGLLIINSLPNLCKEIFTFFQIKSLSWQESSQTGWIILYLVEVILGYLLMTNSRQISEFINKRADSEKEDNNGILD